MHLAPPAHHISCVNESRQSPGQWFGHRPFRSGSHRKPWWLGDAL